VRRIIFACAAATADTRTESRMIPLNPLAGVGRILWAAFFVSLSVSTDATFDAVLGFFLRVGRDRILLARPDDVFDVTGPRVECSMPDGLGFTAYPSVLCASRNLPRFA
jgi:hypothetical protein